MGRQERLPAQRLLSTGSTSTEKGGANSKVGKDPPPSRKLIREEPQGKKKASKKLPWGKKYPSLRNITVGQWHWTSGSTKGNILLLLQFCEAVFFNITHSWQTLSRSGLSLTCGQSRAFQNHLQTQETYSKQKLHHKLVNMWTKTIT